MKWYTFLDLSIVEQVDCHSVRSQWHTDLILHGFCESQESFVEFDCLVVWPFLLVDHTQVEGQMCLFLDVFGVHARLCSHQQLTKSAFFAGKERNWGGITWAWTDGRGNAAIWHIRRLYSDLFLIEIYLTVCLAVIRWAIFKEIDALIKVLPYFCLVHLFDLLIIGWCIGSFFKLQ